MMKRAGRRRDPASLDLYCADVRRFSRLSVEEERALARAGGASRNRLVTAHLGFVIKIAREYRAYGLDLADLVQEGNLGLLRAAARFDPDRNARLLTYAAPWIRAQIHDFVLRSFSLVKVGTTRARRKLFFALGRTTRAVEAERAARGADAGGEVCEEVATKLEVKPAEVEEMSHRLAARDVSLDAAGTGEAPWSPIALLADDRPRVDEELSFVEERELLHGSVREALSRLDERERFVVERRVMSDAPSTLVDIGGNLRVSRERARQLEARATRKLRRELQPLAGERRPLPPQAPPLREDRPRSGARRRALAGAAG
jgi:RNA polymerase sigma-32 factor